MSKKKILKYVYAFVIVLLLVTFFSKSIHHLTLPKVVVSHTQSGYITSDIVFDSYLQSNNSISKYAGMSAVVKSKQFNNGDMVESGDIIYILDDKDLKNKKDLIEHQIETLKSEMSVCNTIYNQYLSKTSIKYDDIVKLKEEKYNTNKILFDAGSISKELYVKSDIEYRSALADYMELKETYKKKLDNLTYDLNIKENELIEISEKIKQCTVISTESGILQSMSFEIGMLTNHNSLLYKVTTPQSGFNISHLIDNSQGKHLKIGDEVTLEVYGKDLSIITFIGEITPRNTEIEFTINVMDEGLTIDDRVRVLIHKKLASYENLLPLEAVRTDNSGTFIYLLVEEDGPLGKEYFAVKENVVIGEKSLRFIGLETTFSKEQYIVIRANKALIGDRIEVYIED